MDQSLTIICWCTSDLGQDNRHLPIQESRFFAFKASDKSCICGAKTVPGLPSRTNPWHVCHDQKTCLGLVGMVMNLFGV